ncbi:hypothetical protein QWY85_12785, partial [Neolewinella lacunae]|nr:hypothetical protein [Neolewinella lacunae]
LDAFDLDVNMALYRTLDPVVGRWWSVDPDVEAFTPYSSYQAMMNSPLVYNDPDGDNPLLVGAVIGVIGNGIGNLFNDRPFFQGAAQAAFFGAFAGGASNIIGGAAGLLPQGGRAAFQAGAHAFVGGSISAAQGGNFLSGAAAGAFSSVTGSIVGASGGSAGLQIAAGALAGGVGSALAGGSFWKGAAQGAITAGLNHAAHNLVPIPYTQKNAEHYFQLGYGEIPDYVDLIADGSYPEGAPGMDGASVDSEGFLRGAKGDVKAGITVPLGPGSNRIYLFKFAFQSEARLFHTIGHEYYHAKLFNAGIFGAQRHHAAISHWDRAVFKRLNMRYDPNYGSSLQNHLYPSDLLLMPNIKF